MVISLGMMNILADTIFEEKLGLWTYVNPKKLSF